MEKSKVLVVVVKLRYHINTSIKNIKQYPALLLTLESHILVGKKWHSHVYFVNVFTRILVIRAVTDTSKLLFRTQENCNIQSGPSENDKFSV